MMKKIFVIILICCVCSVLLSQHIINVPNQYSTIQEAIDHAYTLSGYVTIEVNEGIYYETLDINFTPGLLNLTLIGVDGLENCIIDGGNGQTIVDVENYYQLEKYFKISGFTIRNSVTASGIYAHTSISSWYKLNVDVSGNMIQNCRSGIKLLRLNECLVKDNIINNDLYIDQSFGFGSHYVNNLRIDGNFVCNFTNNISLLSTEGKVINNQIELTNEAEDIGIALSGDSNVSIISNLILIFSDSVGEEDTGIENLSSNATIFNNTIVGFGVNSRGYRNTGTTEKFVNNILWNLETNIAENQTTFEVNYCCFNGTIPPECEPLENHNVIDINPQLSQDYHLTHNSPCIDTGDPDTNGNGVNWQYDEDDRDIDGSRKDMGCYPYLHDYDTKVFTKGVHWVSFPILTQDGIYEPDPPSIPSIPPIDYELYQQAYYEDGAGGLLQDEDGSIGTIDGFINILGNRYGTPMEIKPVLYNYVDHDDDFNNMLFRHEGYKIEVGSVTTSTTLIVGDGINDERLSVDHVIAGTMAPDEYHWLGFWIQQDQKMIESFGDFWQYVEKVKSEEWFYSPANNQRGGDPTYPVVISAENLTLEYGKSYLVLFNQEVENFSWSDTEQPAEKKEKAKPVIFEYTEKADYEAIDVFNIPPNVTEIGVFEDDVCIGAVVVEDTCSQILAYSAAMNREPVPFTFEFVTGRGSSSPVKNYQVYNMQTGKYENRSVFSGRQEYSIVRFGDENEQEDNTPSVPQLHGNYPNPFNPETTISFSTTESTENTELVIYNIRGQRVKELINGKLPSGEHSIVWDGTDGNGRSLCTGIYFYRLETGNKEMSRKMLLLK